MKKNYYLLLLIFLPLTAFAQSVDYEYENVLKINPVSFATSEIQIHYERYLKNRKSSFVVAPSLILRRTDEESADGAQILAQWRYYVSQFNKEDGKNFLGIYNYGFYAGLYSLGHTFQEQYKMSRWNQETQEQVEKTFERNSSSIEFGPMMGLQIDFTKRIVLDFYFGGGVRYSDFTDSIDEDPDFENYSSFDEGVFAMAYTGVKPKLGLSIGINF